MGGPEAVARILPSLGLAPGRTALDVGCGLGGPARQVARTTGCLVTGIDITRAYVDAATALTAVAGLADEVGYVCADVGALEDRDFDAAYTMHVQMNVADKSAFYAAIADKLRPEGRLATFEVCRSGSEDPVFPVAWSIDGTDSHLTTPSDLCATIQDSGFERLEWVDETAWVVEWFEEAGTRMAAADTSATLPALLTDGWTRMLNFAAALNDGVLTVHRGAFLRTPGGRPDERISGE